MANAVEPIDYRTAEIDGTAVTWVPLLEEGAIIVVDGEGSTEVLGTAFWTTGRTGKARCTQMHAKLNDGTVDLFTERRWLSHKEAAYAIHRKAKA